MIKFLYKILHYEASFDHKDNVLRSFYFIAGLISILPFTLVYILYVKWAYNDVIFYAIEVVILASAYFFIVVRRSKVYMEMSVGSEYYNFGKLNVILKTAIFLALVGITILVGRLLILTIE